MNTLPTPPTHVSATLNLVVSADPATIRSIFVLIVLTLEVVYLMYRMLVTPNYNPFNIDTYDMTVVGCAISLALTI